MSPLPDIILFLSDDHAAWAAGCYGNAQVATPNMDHLANQGVLMLNAFTPTPVCSPARACVFTGRTASQHGVHDFIGTTLDAEVDHNWVADELLLPELLRRKGYTTNLVGKWHLGQERVAKQGFDYSFTLGPEYPIHHFGTRTFYRNAEAVQTEGYLARTITDAAIDCLRTRDPAAPLFLVIGHYATHSPWQGHPERLAERYRRKNTRDHFPQTNYPFGFQINESLDATRGNPEESLCQYYAGVSEIDESLGTVLDELKAQGRMDSTLVVYTSDHGLNCSHHGLWGKGNATWPLNMLEQSIRVPLIFHHPGLLFGKQRRTEFVDHTDLFNTILDYADAHEPAEAALRRNSPGRSLRPLLSNSPVQDAPRALQFCEYGPVRMARDARYKLVLYPDERHNLLIDLASDPGEERNRYHDPDCRSIREHLSGALAQHFSVYTEKHHDGSTPGNLPRCNLHPAWVPHAAEKQQKTG
jgi:choline-sulfatase